MENKHDFHRWLEKSKESMQKIKAPSHLWAGIIDGIEKKNIPFFRLNRFLDVNRKLALVLGIIIFITVFGIGFHVYQNQRLISEDKAAYLASEIEEELFRYQEKYESAITKLENRALTGKYGVDNDLVQLYLQKLQIINSLISECKSSLNENPYNPVLNRALVKAYREKISVLKNLIHQSKEVKS